MYDTKLQIPIFCPEYEEDVSYGYKYSKGERLSELLFKTSEGYCMYCYTRILIDSKKFGQLEHAIEKRHSDRLKECVPNLGLACPKCNQSFKKVGDIGEIFTTKQKSDFESGECTKEKCKKECSAYKRLKRRYLTKRTIILQPMGVVKNKKPYRIQYNLLKLEFEPSDIVDYIEDEKDFIRGHINYFNLNDASYRTRELVWFCKDFINGDKYIRKGKYNNYIVDLFIDLLMQLGAQERERLCELVYKIAMMKKVI